ncbi:GTP 3',8-cyclase MoaA [Desulfosporosinus shakirovi]|uniref:GTP 3',8-cyclase MoaA n=1 Tax=Desulfosporosinus shakirovi TaxID=2885154 RepID=UPI001E4D6AAF|nr:GTP 3',8-cyclase MoaA [Desulfosporosinus sp. SRJS8]MCB8816964.1 GTP 3',8-cyclase MoaA [Desulfosporosinus sp. SRJS8]
MQDQFLRRIDYLRISVTDRCNLRCKYCMPVDGIEWMPHDLILSFEEILRLMKISTQLGFRRFRITGGEPLVRKDILDFLREAAQLPGVEDLMLTTNGMLLQEMAFDLKAAGVQRVNISLDTMDRTRFFENTRGGDVSKVIQGILRSLEAGLNPVKINVVVVRGFNTEELPSFLKLARQYPLHVRFIELMPIGVSSEHRNEFVSIKEMKEVLGLNEDDLPTKDIPGGGPAQYFRPSGYKGSIGFISALSRHFCNTCNRVRLTADGKLKPCLHSKHEVDLREVLRSGSSDQDILNVFAQAVWHKPAEHHMNSEAWQDTRVMSQIGG